MIAETTTEKQESCNEELAIRLYDILHTRDIKRQTTLQWPVANKLGINQALLLEIVHNWTEYNAHKGALSYFHDDNWWTSDTYENWFASYPSFGSVRTLQRLFKELEDLDYIISCRPFGKGKNGTKFYRVNKAKVGMLLLNDSPFCHVPDPEPRQTGNSDSPNRQEGSVKVADPTIYINNKKEENKNNNDSFALQKDLAVNVQVLSTDVPPISQVEARFKYGANEAYFRQQAAIIWMSEKPRNFVDLPGERIDHQSWKTFKRDYLNHYGEEALTMLRESLIYAREYNNKKSRDTFSWSNSDVRLTFGQWVDSSKTEKIDKLRQQHQHSMKYDRDYADRVEGRVYGNEITDYIDIPLNQRDKANELFNYAKGINAEQEKIEAQCAFIEAAKLKRQQQEEERKLKLAGG